MKKLFVSVVKLFVLFNTFTDNCGSPSTKYTVVFDIIETNSRGTFEQYVKHKAKVSAALEQQAAHILQAHPLTQVWFPLSLPEPV